MKITMYHGDRLLSSIFVSSEKDARLMFLDMIKENVAEGYEIVSKQRNKAILAKPGLFNVFAKRLTLELSC